MRVVVALAALGLLLMALSVLYPVGCTDTIDGEVYINQKPIVDFANIPPEGGKFSRNEVVYWYGTDPDGLIDYYRYYIAKVSEVGFTAPEDFILTIPNADWIYVDVDSAQDNPQTENVIPLVADLDNPVNIYVSQWIFLQAFDMEGLGSDIVFRLFSRNDHPPVARILPIPESYLPFVNSPDSGGIVTGVKLSWSGSDRLDYPEGDWPPFEFQWRLYGPYDDAAFKNVVDSFVRPTLVTIDGRVFEEGDTAVFCDTIYGDSIIIECDSQVVCDTTKVTWGSSVKKLCIDDEGFINNPAFNKLVDCSCDDDLPPDDPTDCVDTWILNTSDVLYDVYKYDQFDTTVQMWFLFWIRCRDDAFVADLVPTFDSFPVIDPRYEREVAVIDFSGNPSKKVVFPEETLRVAYWEEAINNWRPGIDFDTTGIYSEGIAPDYLNPLKREQGAPLAMLLKHKVLILYDDRIAANFDKYSHSIYTAIDAGVNVWATWRVPMTPYGDETVITYDYLWYFGVSRMAYSHWYNHAMSCCGRDTSYECARVEDFSGAYAIDSLEWPNLTIDTARLHNFFQWSHDEKYDSCLGFMPEHPGFPEVNWSVRSPSRPTEVLYLYKSIYTDTAGTSNHPLGGMYNMEGNPGAHKLSTTQFRTVHFNFTPLPIQQDSMQKVVNRVLDWLYPYDLPSPTSKIRYPDATVKLSVSQARERYWQRCEEKALEEKMQHDLQEDLR
jgi:hypothetical protein